MKKFIGTINKNIHDLKIIASGIADIVERNRLADSVKSAMFGLMLFLGTLLLVTQKNSNGAVIGVSFLDYAYFYGGLINWLFAFATLVASVYFFAKAMTWMLETLYNIVTVYEVVKTNAAQAEAKKREKAKRVIYKKALENAVPNRSRNEDSFEAMKERFDPILPLVHEILARHEQS